MDLSIGLIYWLYLFIGFIYSIWWLYLLGLSIGFSFSVHSIHPHSNLIQIFSQLRKEHLYISLTIHISRSHGKNLPLSITPHSGLIKLTLLQLHHRTSLIKLMNITSLHHIYYTCSLIKLTNITSLHRNYYTCSILTLHYPNIISHYFRFLANSFSYSTSTLAIHFYFTRFKMSLIIPSPITYGILRNCCFSPATLKLIQDHDQSTKTQCSAPSAPRKLTERLSRIWRLPAPTRILMHVVIKPVMVYQSAKLVMRKILVALSPGNVFNMALESPKLLYHLLQFMNN